LAELQEVVGSVSVSIPLVELNDETKSQLHAQFAAADSNVAAAG